MTAISVSNSYLRALKRSAVNTLFWHKKVNNFEPFILNVIDQYVNLKGMFAYWFYLYNIKPHRVNVLGYHKCLLHASRDGNLAVVKYFLHQYYPSHKLDASYTRHTFHTFVKEALSYRHFHVVRYFFDNYQFPFYIVEDTFKKCISEAGDVEMTQFMQRQMKKAYKGKLCFEYKDSLYAAYKKNNMEMVHYLLSLISPFEKYDSSRFMQEGKQLDPKSVKSKLYYVFVSGGLDNFVDTSTLTNANQGHEQLEVLYLETLQSGPVTYRKLKVVCLENIGNCNALNFQYHDHQGVKTYEALAYTYLFDSNWNIIEK